RSPPGRSGSSAIDEDAERRAPAPRRASPPPPRRPSRRGFRARAHGTPPARPRRRRRPSFPAARGGLGGLARRRRAGMEPGGLPRHAAAGGLSGGRALSPDAASRPPPGVHRLPGAGALVALPVG